MHCMLMDLLHGFEVLSTTEETLFNSRNFEMNLTFTQALPFGFNDSIVVSVLKLFLQKNN